MGAWPPLFCFSSRVSEKFSMSLERELLPSKRQVCLPRCPESLKHIADCLEQPERRGINLSRFQECRLDLFHHNSIFHLTYHSRKKQFHTDLREATILEYSFLKTWEF